MSVNLAYIGAFFAGFFGGLGVFFLGISSLMRASKKQPSTQS